MKILVAFVLSFVLTSCNSQSVKNTTKSQNNVKKDTMERFNKALFDQKKIDGHYEFTLDDGTIIKQWEEPSEYYAEQTIDPKSNFTVFKEFYFTSGILKLTGKEFYGFPVGIWKEFSEKGELIKEENEDAPFKFSIYDLHEKLKKMGIDIMKPGTGVSVARTVEPIPKYNVSHPIAPNDYSATKIMVFDGTDGKLITETIKKYKN